MDEEKQFTENIEDVRGKALVELERMEGYKRIYETSHHKKPKQALSFRKELGVVSILFWIAGICGIFLVSIRTATVFMQSEGSLLAGDTFVPKEIHSFLIFASGFLTVGAVECYLFSLGLQGGKNDASLKYDWIGFGIAFSISAIAGYISTTKISPEIANSPLTRYMYWLLSGAVGIGGSALVWRSSHNIGIIDNLWRNRVAENDAEYEKYLKEWDEKFTRDYTRIGAAQLGNSALRNMTKEDRLAKSQETEEKEVATRLVHSRVVEWLKVNGINANEVNRDGPITPKVIADSLGLPNSGAVRVAISRLKDETPAIEEMQEKKEVV